MPVTGARSPLFQRRLISVENDRAIRIGVINDFSLTLNHSCDRAKALEMSCARIQQSRNVWLGNRRQVPNFANCRCAEFK